MRYSAPCAELTFRSEDLGVFNFCVGRSAFDVLRSEAAARPPPVKQTLAPPGASQVWRMNLECGGKRYSALCAELIFRSEDLGVFNFCVGRSAFDVLRSEAAARPPPVKQTLAPPGASQVWRKNLDAVFRTVRGVDI
jgi:hypothetical protein